MGCANSSAAGADKQKGAGQDAKGGDKEADKKNAKGENKELVEIMKFLEEVNLLKRLPKDQLPLLAAAMTCSDFKSGEVIIKQGDSGDAFFLIKEGEAQVMIDGKEVAKLRNGDYFGEGALLREDPRAATICVTSPNLTAFKMTRSKFQELKLPDQLQFANRNAIGAGKMAEAICKPPTPKTAADEKLLEEGLKNNTALAGVVSLDDARVKKLVAVSWKEDITSGTAVVTEGDPNADYFYIVESGTFEVFSGGGGPQSGDAPKQMLTTISAGGSFGELALLYLTPRAATVKATSNAVVWVIDRTNFKNVLMQVSDKKVDEYHKLLKGCATFAAMSNDELSKIAKALVEMHFSKEEVILQQGEFGSTFYLLYEGDVAIVVDGNQVSKLTVKKGSDHVEYFGEKALMSKDGAPEKRAATVKVLSETAKALALDKGTFDAALRPVHELMKQNKGPDDSNRTKVNRQDLSRVGLLGCGGFGAVELWEHKQTGETYAMKALSKGYIVKTGMQESVMNEKNILSMTNSPFIIKLYETYNGQQSLYFLMEPALGGELYATYNRKGLHGSEKHAKFYIAGTVFAFEHCHERHIIYRDLKPENLLLTDMGQVKLTDMGLAKFVIGKTFTTCGTPDYFAPEIIASTGHTNAVDWWMLGILLFELLSGRPPFESAYPMQTYSKVMKGIGKVTFPSKCTGLVEQLIKGLLKREPSERLPMRPGGTNNIKEAKWYSSGKFDWKAMLECKAEPPYKPVVKSKKDIANFSARKEDMPKQIQYTDPGTGWDKDFASR